MALHRSIRESLLRSENDNVTRTATGTAPQPFIGLNEALSRTVAAARAPEQLWRADLTQNGRDYNFAPGGRRQIPWGELQGMFVGLRNHKGLKRNTSSHVPPTLKREFRKMVKVVNQRVAIPDNVEADNRHLLGRVNFLARKQFQLGDGEFLTEEQILEIIVASRRATSTMRYREKKKESAAAATSNTLPTDTLPTDTLPTA